MVCETKAAVKFAYTYVLYYQQVAYIKVNVPIKPQAITSNFPAHAYAQIQNNANKLLFTISNFVSDSLATFNLYYSSFAAAYL